MHLAQVRSFDKAETVVRRHRAVANVVAFPTAAVETRGGYGEGRRLSLPAVGIIALLHVLAIVAMVKLDVIAIARPHRDMKVFDIQEAPPPPPEPVAPPPVAKVVPPVAVPVVAPPPIVAAPTPPPVLQTVREAPPPVLAPVAVPEPPKPAPGVATMVSDRLSIVAKDPLPRYPADSRRKHEEGVVRLRVTVAVDGSVTAIAVAASSGFKRLDDAALEAVRHWRFRPKVQDGVTVEALGFIPIPFNLN